MLGLREKLIKSLKNEVMFKMIYPKFLRKSGSIGVTAVSDGITGSAKLYRLDNAISKFQDLGYSIIETSNVRSSCLGRSSASDRQASFLMDLYLDDRVDVIMCASGGEFLLEMLPFVDFDIIRKNPKWLQGYSDPTGLLFTITTNLDIATIYGSNFCVFGMKNWHKSCLDNLEILKGNIISQESFDLYESGYLDYVVGDEEYNLDKEVNWEILTNQDSVCCSGRMIGGCIDILNDLFGTRFDNTKNFINKYKSDGIIWYFDNCDFSSEQLIRTLWKFRDNGWFDGAKCIIFGRSAREESYCGISNKLALDHSLSSLNIPIIMNVDIGHVAPRMTIINGAMARIWCENGKGRIDFSLDE